MINCGCNTGFICLTHRFEGRTGNSADSDLMAKNDDISDLYCKACGQSKHPQVEHPFCHNSEPTPEELDKELIATMYQIRIEYQAMKERMEQFEALFVHHSDQIITMGKHIGKLEQWANVWMDGRGGIS